MDNPVFICLKSLVRGYQYMFQKGKIYAPVGYSSPHYILKDELGGEYKISLEGNEILAVHGWRCRKHGIGYITACPTCASIANPIRESKKEKKRQRQERRKLSRR